jgi:hypothetical protein
MATNPQNPFPISPGAAGWTPSPIPLPNNYYGQPFPDGAEWGANAFIPPSPFSGIRSNVAYPNARTWTPLAPKGSNIQPGGIAQQLTGFGISSAASFFGIPQVAQVGNELLELSENYSPYNRYNVGTARSMRPLPGVKYADFRSRKFVKGDSISETILENIAGTRLDGTSAALRGSLKAGVYAGATATPAGAYSIFNLNGFGKTGYGWGDHDNPYALRNDFTARSHVATNVNKARIIAQGVLDNVSGTGIALQLAEKVLEETQTFTPTNNPIEMITPFRGDKVTVIDFGKRKLKDAYQWNPRLNILGAIKADQTQDFIKFFFTGPKLQAGNVYEKDDIIVFRAILGSLTDTFSPNWNEVQMIGRADPNYHYTGFSRDISLDFKVFATSRDELKPIYRKLNALAGYTAPTYSDNIALEAPWMRFTIGDLFYQQPGFISSLTYTMIDQDTTWEINVEDDPTNMQVPFSVGVSMGLTIVSDQLPQKGGRFYTLAKRFNREGQPKIGNDNWLSDAIGQRNKSFEEIKQELDELKAKGKGVLSKTGKAKNTKTAKDRLNKTARGTSTDAITD